jgi:hypothetical protein
VAKLVKRPIVVGIVLGLGFGFMIEGAKMMAQNWWVGGSALLGTSLLLANRAIPAMFLLLLFGAGYGILRDPTLIAALGTIGVVPRLPTLALAELDGSPSRRHLPGAAAAAADARQRHHCHHRGEQSFISWPSRD